MQVVVWIIIILAIIFLIWLLRKWIKRLIFILILLVLAFLIYGIFNPSGAARLWYNIRTFPQRMASWMGSEKEFLDYDKYKLDISEIGDKIDLGDDDEDLDSDEESDIDIESDEDEIKDKEKNRNDKSDEIKDEEDSDDTDNRQTIKAFPRSVRFVEFPELKQKDESEKAVPLTGYSKSDLLGVINKYIEKNLDDDTDILVTVEYDEEGSTPQKIILQTQPRISGKGNSVYFFEGTSDEMDDDEDEWVEIDATSYSANTSDNQVKKNTQSVKKTTSTKLTQSEQKEAEEIFSILF